MNAISVSSTLTGNRLTSTVTVPKGLRKYFNSFRLFAHYDAPLRADMSILNIPLVSTILPLAWLTGTDVHVEKLDRKYVEAMNAIKNEFRQMFPRGRFTTEITVDYLVENKIQSQGTAMLFSGGVDSTYSLIRNVSLKPKLIMFFGVVGYQLDSSYKKHNQLVRKTYSDFARREGLVINFVDTNTSGILNDSRITHDFHRILRGSPLWDSLQLPLVLLGLPAPLSIGRFNRLLMAADSSPPADSRARELSYKHPYASQPWINEKFAWADLRVILDAYVDRFSKTSLVKEYLKKHEYRLRVCNDPPLDRLNCSTCEKCSRTIVPLILERVDPNNCGFEVNRSTFESMRSNLEKKKFETWREVRWKKAQNLIPYEMETDLWGSRDFFMWLRNLDIDSVRKKRNLHKDLFNLLPYHLAVLFDAFSRSVHGQSVSRSINTLLTSFLRQRVKNLA
jgi:hypothetical protein